MSSSISEIWPFVFGKTLNDINKINPNFAGQLKGSDFLYQFLY